MGHVYDRRTVVKFNKRWLLLILFIAFAYRAPTLDAPIIGEHSWRQSDTAAMARNFSENGYRILHPQIDWGGQTSGEVECEFPLYPFLVALLYKIFGVSEIWARALSLLFSMVSLAFFYLLVRDHADEKTALWSSAFLAVLPLNALFGCAVMPEPLMLMASISGVYYFSKWTRTNNYWHFGVSAVLIATACLLKIPCLYLGAPLLYLAWFRFRGSVLWTPCLWLYAFLVLAPVGLWYFHAHQIFLDTGLTFGIWEYGEDKWGNWDLVLSWKYWNRILLNRLAHRHLTWLGFAVFLTGLGLKRKNKREWLFDVWLVGLAVFLFIVGRGNYIHNYYQLPLLFPVTVFIGKVYARYFHLPIGRSAASIALAVVFTVVTIMSTISLVKFRERENPEVSSVFQLAENLKDVSNRSDKVIIITNSDPTLLYLAHRKGWRESLKSLPLESVRKRIEQGAMFIAGTHDKKGWSDIEAQRFSDLQSEYSVITNNDRFYLIRLVAVK